MTGVHALTDFLHRKSTFGAQVASLRKCLKAGRCSPARIVSWCWDLLDEDDC